MTVKRSQRKPLVIDVDGGGRNTRYNDAFENPLEVTPSAFNETVLRAHIEESLARAIRFIQQSQNPTPVLLPLGEEALEDAEAEEGIFDPNNIEDAREKVAREITLRRGQPKFRRLLLESYGARCAITGCSVVELLEAAHIVPYRGPDTNRPSNGLLLRADIHTLFDLNLITIDPSTLKITIAPSLENTEYSAISGRILEPPAQLERRPNKEALEWRKLFPKATTILKRS